MKNKKTALLHSVLSLILCISMLMGTTFAWFTDEVTSENNIIKSGTLDVEMYYGDTAGDITNDASKGTIFNYEYWEPGFTQIKYVKIDNKGDLAFKYRLDIIPNTPAAAGDVNLADVIDVYMVEVDPAAPVTIDRAAIAAKTPVGTLSQLMKDADGAAYGIMLPNAGAANVELKDADKDIAKTGTAAYCIALKMQESAGNEYQNKTVGGKFSVRLLAAQYTYEGDSFGTDYDSTAQYKGVIDFTASAAVTADAATGTLTQDTAIGNEGEISAAVPAGVKLADGTTELELSVKTLKESEANVRMAYGETKQSLDIHVEGVSEDNTVPMTITLPGLLKKNLGNGNVKLYHVEDGVTNEMAHVDTPVNHNEFSYDSTTGDVVVCLQSFSEVAAVANTKNPWDGETVTAYTGTGTEADPYLIVNAEQFVYFRDQVDGGKDYAGEFVKLDDNINLNGHNFDPIGWGYDNTEWNAGGADGKVFKGHFDGGNHTISGLYQNGWDLEAATPDADYTYTNCGGGLFACALDATFENLTIDGADIRFECVEIGVLVGLAQGNCTFNNINITGCKIANYQRPAGGVVGEVSPKVENGAAVASTHTFNNVYVDSNTVVGSMWGDFDAPVGGVIGAYWDDAGKTSVSMTNVTVAARLDVYNDVTSTYQWYAYRRAGMLIGGAVDGNPRDGSTATAPFLTCSNVVVYYGEWADYHYCEFNKANPNWPWVRVEPGENCDGYSNPRWGRPNDPTTGQPVTDSVHDHGDGEGHLQSIPFRQLYGGGQGVYGEDEHPGVSEGIYTVTYMDHGEVLHVDYVTDNTKAYDCSHVDGIGIWPKENVTDANGNPPSYWVKGDNTKFEVVNAGNTANVIVYPKWPNEYTIRCLDTYGEVAYYNFVTDDNTTPAEYQTIATEINNTLVNIQNEVDKDKKVMIIVWEKEDGSTVTDVTANDIQNAVKAKKDFILSAVPQLQNTSITLEPYYDPTTGELVAYCVTEVAQGDSNTSVVIPDYVGKIPVTVINEGAAEGFDKLHATTIPGTIENIGNNAFASKPKPSLFSDGKFETQTFYYDGDPTKFNEQLQKHLDTGESEMFSRSWDSGLGTGSRIFFLKEGKVDPDAGYWELTEVQIKKGGSWYSPTLESEEYVWTYYASVRDQATAFTNEYTGDCDCGCGTRPDEAYWVDVFN